MWVSNPSCYWVFGILIVFFYTYNKMKYKKIIIDEKEVTTYDCPYTLHLATTIGDKTYKIYKQVDFDEQEEYRKCKSCDLFKKNKYPQCWSCYNKNKIPTGYINYI